MTNLKFDKEITALLVIDPYNDFISRWRQTMGSLEDCCRGKSLCSSYVASPECRAEG
jgi:hypothetical protein